MFFFVFLGNFINHFKPKKGGDIGMLIALEPKVLQSLFLIDKTMKDKMNLHPLLNCPSKDRNYWLKRLDTQINETTN